MNQPDYRLIRARGRKVTVDAAALMDFVRRSRELHDFINQDLCAAESRACEARLERWEIAHVTLLGSINQ